MTEEALFQIAAAAPETERAALLDRECAGKPELRARLEQLLAAEGRTNRFVPPADEHNTRSHRGAPIGEVGQVVAGRYTLVEAIGEGGMGSVWRAKQTEPVKRMVAVKLIKAGMDTKGVLARFEAERQALAVMDHPNIAKILDGGVHDNRPFFVMELVKGVPITEYCDARKLTPKERLELFVPVCNAIQHAHQKGIIHRDIKPSNVLVALYDDRPVPKVIDFGVAKATGGALTEMTIDTGFGGIVGTPQYMSPEQATFNNLDIDTRSDVYSLGVLLYELLAGSPPFTMRELKNAGLLEMLRVVREVDPPKPSTKFSTAAATASLGALRGTEPKKLTAMLRSELDWIVLKSLEKDRSRRYETANGFAADVQRYLSGEAVQAHPPSAGYRLRKFVRRNKGRVAAGGAVAATLCGGLAGTTWQAIRAEREAERVRAEEQKTRTALTQAELNQQQAERFLAQSYLRPIGYQSSLSSFDPAELYAIKELAELSAERLLPTTISGDSRGDLVKSAEEATEDRIKLLCLAEALAEPGTAYRIARRAERFMQAVVGGSTTRRKAAIELLGAKQRDATADPRVRVSACFLALELGSDDLPALEESCRVVIEIKGDESEFFVDLIVRAKLNQVQFESTLRGFLPRIYSGDWAKGGTYGWDKYRDSKDFYTALGNVRCADFFLKSLEASDAKPTPEIIRALAEIAPKLDFDRQQRAATAVRRHLPSVADNDTRRTAYLWLKTQGLKIDAASAVVISESLLFSMESMSEYEFATITSDLLSIAPLLDEAASLKVTIGLYGALRRTTAVDKTQTLSDAILIMLPKLTAEGKASVARELDRLLATTTDEDQFVAAARVLLALPTPTRRVEIGEAADRVLERIRLKPNKNQADIRRAQDMVDRYRTGASSEKPPERLADRLLKTTEPKEFVEAADLLIRADRKRYAPIIAGELVRMIDLAAKNPTSDTLTRLIELAVRFDRRSDQLSARVLKSMLTALNASDQVGRSEAALQAIAAYAAASTDEVSAADAAMLADALLAHLTADVNSRTRELLLKAVRPLAPLLDKPAAERIARKLLLQSSVDKPNADEIINCLAALSSKLDAEDTAKIVEVMLISARKPIGSNEVNSVRLGFVKLAPRLESAPASRICEMILDKLMEVDADWWNSNPNLTTDALVALAPRLAREAATRIAVKIVPFLEATRNEEKLAILAQVLRAVDPERFAKLKSTIASRGLAETLETVADNGNPSDTLTIDYFLNLHDDWRAIAPALTHPGCVGSVRVAVLRRLEQLLVRPLPTALPESVVVAHGGVAGGWTVGVPEPMRAAHILELWERERRFTTTWNVLAFLAEKHPDFKLGRMPKQPRGK